MITYYLTINNPANYYLLLLLLLTIRNINYIINTSANFFLYIVICNYLKDEARVTSADLPFQILKALCFITIIPCYRYL